MKIEKAILWKGNDYAYYKEAGKIMQCCGINFFVTLSSRPTGEQGLLIEPYNSKNKLASMEIHIPADRIPEIIKALTEIQEQRLSQ